MNRRLLWATSVFAYLFTMKLMYVSYGRVKSETGDAAAAAAASSKNPDRGSHLESIDPQYIHHDTLLMVFLFQISLILIYPIIQVYYFIKFHISPTTQLLLCLNFHKASNKNESVYDFDFEDEKENSDAYDLHKDGHMMETFYPKEDHIENMPQLADYKMTDRTENKDVPLLPQFNANIGTPAASPTAPFSNMSGKLDTKMDENNQIDTIVSTNGAEDSRPRLTSSITRRNSMLTETASKTSFKDVIKILQSLQVFKTTIMSSLICIASLAFFKSIAMLPLLDITIISNLSIFEICSLLFTCFGILSKGQNRSLKQTLVDFIGMIIACISVLMMTWKRQGTLLASTVNTNDPFIFERLAGCLICGLGCLAFGPALVIWFKYLYPHVVYLSKKESTVLSHETFPGYKMRKVWQTSLLSFQTSMIGVINFALLGLCLIFRSQKTTLPTTTASVSPADAATNGVAQNYFDLNLVLAGMFGATALIFSFLQLTLEETTGYITTLCLGNICFSPFVEFFFPDAEFVPFTAGELKSYGCLFIGLLWLTFFSYYHKK